MSDINQLGANIRSLRKAYGETQEQLGIAINYEKNTVSSYETGRTEPDKETLMAIAQHFMVSVEELMHCDLTSIEKITVDQGAFWKSIDVILPIVSSETALKNESFRKAFKAHKLFYDQLHMVSLDGIDNVDVCFDGYLDAFLNDEIEAEASANFLAIWFLLMLSLKTVPMIMKNQPAALKQVALRDENAKRIIEDPDLSFQVDAESAFNEINDSETKEILTEMLIAVKKSKTWSDLADYYLALKYVWNLVDNDLDWGFNQRIGIEMMGSFKTVKNIYAARFLKYSFDSINGTNSQTVDDT